MTDAHKCTHRNRHSHSHTRHDTHTHPARKKCPTSAMCTPHSKLPLGSACTCSASSRSCVHARQHRNKHTHITRIAAHLRSDRVDCHCASRRAQIAPLGQVRCRRTPGRVGQARNRLLAYEGGGARSSHVTMQNGRTRTRTTTHCAARD
jgi:hypothetical protein